MELKGLFVQLPKEQIFRIDTYAEKRGKKKYRAISELLDIGLDNIGD